MAQTITINSYTGTFPFNVTICDFTYSECYLAATSVPSIPVTLDIPTQLQGLLSILVVIEDNSGCQFFEHQICEILPEINPCSVIFQNATTLFSNGYDITPNNFTASTDVAHFWDPSTNTGYIWVSVNSAKVIREWKITNLSPLTYDTTYNGVGYRDVTYPSGILLFSNGMCSKSINELVTVNQSTRNVIIVVSVSYTHLTLPTKRIV